MIQAWWQNRLKLARGFGAKWIGCWFLGVGTLTYGAEESIQTWTWGSSDAQGKYHISVLTLHYQEAELTRATLKQPGGAPVNLACHQGQNGWTSLALPARTQEEPAKVLLEGCAEDGVFQGRIALHHQDHTTTLPWKAWLVPPHPLGGSWQWRLQITPDNLLTGTLQLVDEPGKLSGVLIIQGRTLPLEALNFEQGRITFTTQGEENLTYHSTAYWLKDRLVGSVRSDAFGSDQSLMWQATHQQAPQ